MRKTLRCVDCQSEFSYDYNRGRPRQRCDRCTTVHKAATDAAKSKRWREANPERQREVVRRHYEKRKQAPDWREKKLRAALVREYGLTLDDFQRLLDAQGGVCAICGGPPNGPGGRLHVDHCHESSRIRGLLCSRCNTAIGLLADDPARAESAAAYLRR